MLQDGARRRTIASSSRRRSERSTAPQNREMENVPSTTGKRVYIVLACIAIVSLVVLIPILIFEIPTYASLTAQAQRNYGEAFPYVPVEAAINSSIDPCVDFYEFACGQWENHASKLTESSFITPFSVLQNSVNSESKSIFRSATRNEAYPSFVNSAITFYRACSTAASFKGKNNDGTLLELLDEIGGFPLLGRDYWQPKNYYWEKSCGLILKALGIDTVLSVQIGIDESDSTENIMFVKGPAPSQSLFDEHSTRVVLHCIVTSLLNADIKNLREFYLQIDEMLVLEHIVEQYLTKFNDSFGEPERMTIVELQREVPYIHWLSFFQGVTNETLNTINRPINESETILVGDLTFLKAITRLLSMGEVKKQTVANLMGWYVIREFSALLPSAVKKYSKHFGFTENDTTEIITSKCYEKSADMFSDALSYLYIINHPAFDEESFRELIMYLKKSFRSTIESNKWLDNLTKDRILSKLDVMCEIVGYSGIFRSRKLFDKAYLDFPSMTDDHIKNFISTLRYFVTKNILLLRTQNKFGVWDPPRPVTHVGAYYVVDRNTIVLPMAMQHRPFFYQEGPRYLTYGAIGSMIGHEINHGYDIIGRKRDKSGTITSWWSNDSIHQHNLRLACFESQYEKYYIEGTETYVDGVKTLSENVADSTGLEQAYWAYKSWEEVHGKELKYPDLEQYTSDQMFFIGFASQYCAMISPTAKLKLANIDTHSPPRLRVWGSISNSEAFAKAFNCPLGSPMNPEHKCKIW